MTSGCFPSGAVPAPTVAVFLPSTYHEAVSPAALVRVKAKRVPDLRRVCLNPASAVAWERREKRAEDGKAAVRKC